MDEMPTLQVKIDRRRDEQEIKFPSNDLFLPPVMQIGQSLSETKEHYIQKSKISVVPSTSQPPLSEIREAILKLIAVNGGFSDYDLITNRPFTTSFANNKRVTGFIFLANSLSVALDIHTRCSRPCDIIGDVFISLPYQPTLVITIVNNDDDPDKSNTYNTAVARGVCMSLGRFMDEGFKTAHGVIKDSELKDENVFKTRLDKIIKASTKFVTYNSVAMNPKKYDKVLTAFMASLSVTKSVCSSSDGPDSCLRLLIKDQCVALVENINEKEVDIVSKPGTGTTILMAEAARRLSRQGKTLLVCEKTADIENLRKKNLDIKVCNMDDPEACSGLGYSGYTCVVNETPLEGTELKNLDYTEGVHWVHHRLQESKDSNVDTSKICRKRTLSEGDENVSGGTKRRRDPAMEFDKEKVNTNHCHINTNDELVNTKLVTSTMLVNTELVTSTELVNSPRHQGHKAYKRYWGTCSTVHIPATSATLTTLPAYCWEVHAEIEPKHPQEQATAGHASWGPILEFGVVEESKADQRVWISQQKQRFWCLTVDGCKVHFLKYCTRINREVMSEKDTINCHPQDISSTQITSLKYGVLVDVHRDMIAFFDLVHENHLETIIADFKETLLPMLAVKHIPKNNFNVKLKLLSGKMIDMTDEKKSLIMKAYKKL